MSDLNQCSFIGRLGRDPETRYTQSGSAVTNITIACGWKGKDKEGTDWVPVVFFGRLAEVAGEYLRKGSQVFIQGSFKTEQWEKDGEKRYRTKIYANTLKMLGSKPEGQPEHNAYAEAKGRATLPQGDAFDDSDIPFNAHERGWLV